MLNGNEIDLVQIMLESGFVVKSVMVVLILGSIFSWAVIFSKYKQFKAVSESNELFLEVCLCFL